MQRSFRSRVLSLLLVFVMTIGFVPLSAIVGSIWPGDAAPFEMQAYAATPATPPAPPATPPAPPATPPAPPATPPAPPSGNVVKTVQVFLDGQPMPDVEVLMLKSTPSGPSGYVSEQTADSSGNVTFNLNSAALSGAQLYFYIENWGLGNLYYNGKTENQLFTIDTIPDTINLRSGATATAKVYLNGSLKSGVEVMLTQVETYGYSQMYSRTSDANGEVIFKGLNFGDSYFFSVKRAAGEYSEYDGEELGKIFVAGAAVPDIHLSVGQTYTANVSYLGAPVNNVRVRLRSTWGKEVETRTDASGLAIFTNFEVAQNEFAYYEVLPRRTDPFAFYIGSIHDKFVNAGSTNIVLEKGYKVTANVTLNGTPYDEKVKIIYQSEQGPSLMNKTDEQNTVGGTTVFTNIPASVKYSFYIPRNEGVHAGYYPIKADAYLVSGDNAQHTINLIEGYDVTTRVYLDGVAKARAYVRILRYGDYADIGNSGYTDSNGYITLHNVNPYTQYMFAVNAQNGVNARYVGAFANSIFSVPATSYPEIHMESGSSVKGKFTLNGIGLDKAEVNLYRIDRASGMQYFVSDAITDANGNITFTNIPTCTSKDYFFTVFYKDTFYDNLEDYSFSTPYAGTLNIELNGKPTTGKGSSSGGGGGGGGGSWGGGFTATTPTQPVISPLTQAEANSAVQSAVKKAQADGSKQATITLKNKGEATLAVLQSIAKSANMPVKLHSDSMNGTAVEVRISLDPSKSTKSLNLHATMTGSRAASIKGIFNKHFKNEICVLSMDQQDSFGQSVEIALITGFKNVKAEDIAFYAYNSKTNKYIQIQPAKSWIDSNGYLHFVTEQAGDILISNGTLAKK